VLHPFIPKVLNILEDYRILKTSENFLIKTHFNFLLWISYASWNKLLDSLSFFILYIACDYAWFSILISEILHVRMKHVNCTYLPPRMIFQFEKKHSTDNLFSTAILSVCRRATAPAWRKWVPWGASRRMMFRGPKRTGRSRVGPAQPIRPIVAVDEFSCCKCWCFLSYRSSLWSCKPRIPSTTSWSTVRRCPT